MRLLTRFHVDARAAPWSPPRTIAVTRRSGAKAHVHKKDAALVAWQDAVRQAMLKSFDGVPYEGPAFLHITFIRGTDDMNLWGSRWWNARPCRGHADLTNLLKSSEDALKTYRRYKGTGKARVLLYVVPGVIAEDSQVCDQKQSKRYGPRDGADIRVYALED